MVTEIKYLRRNQGLAKKFSCCVSYCLVEAGDHGVQISIFIYQRGKRCKSTTCSCLESTHHCWIVQLLVVKPDSWLVWVGFLDFLRRVWKVIITMPSHGRFQHLHLGMFWFWQFKYMNGTVSSPRCNQSGCDVETNDRGLKLLDFTTYNNLALANTQGNHKPSRRWTCHSPNGPAIPCRGGAGGRGGGSVYK